jgi:mRNA interferase RelE/StbE
MWQIKVHRLVIKEDFKKIGRSTQALILKTIYKKLSVAPEQYGSPLRSELRGYWKLRVADYRVIYRVERDIVRVLVLKVGLRRDEEVYKEMIQRLKNL